MRLSGIGPLSLESSINLPKHFSFIYGYVLTILDYISHLIIHNFSKFVKFVLIIKKKIQSNNVHGKFFLCMIYICLCLSLYPSNRLLGESKQRSNGKHFLSNSESAVSNAFLNVVDNKKIYKHWISGSLSFLHSYSGVRH